MRLAKIPLLGEKAPPNDNVWRASEQYILTDKLSIRGNLTLLAQGAKFASIALRFFAYCKENDNGSGFGDNAVKWIHDVFAWRAFKNFAEEM